MAKVKLIQSVETDASASGNYTSPDGGEYYDEYPQGATGTILQKMAGASLVKFDEDDLGCTWFDNSVLVEVE